MTDGIIQEVVNKLLTEHTKKDTFGLFPYPFYTSEEIIKMEQELIEKIKQNVNKGFRCSCVDTDEIIQMLIGDNQE